MLTLMDTPEFLEEMEARAKQLAQGIAAALAGKGSVRTLVKESELLAVSPSSLIHILKGVFRCQHGDKTIRLYSSGDLLLAPGAGESDGISITSEFGAEVRVVPREEFVAALASDRLLLADWLDYQSLETRIGHLLCSLYITEEVRHDPEIREYQAGDVIIREEDDPQEVYEMIQGCADVSSRGTPLATIKGGEVFGELSFFTGLKRTATVTAVEPCLVQVIDQKQFLRVMKYRPVLVEGMIRTLCHRLVDLNRRVAAPKP
jgi:CRP/FNR family transcriptional regulator, cyclic AMP receptor protein